MGKRSAERFTEDDYFAEPNYDHFSDEELDELYSYGEIRQVSPSTRLAGRGSGSNGKQDPARRLTQELHEIDVDFDDSYDLFDDDEY